jgi:sugar phosphate isomerase/epimerase
MMLSVQLWSLRAEIAREGAGAVIERIAAEGFTAVEPFAVAETVDVVEVALAATGLTAPTAHGDLTGDALAPTLDAAARLGVTTIVHPAFFADRWQAPDGVDRIAEELNRAAAAAGALGMRVAFHNHDAEVRLEEGGRPALVALMDRVGPGVGVEFDPHWAGVGGGEGLDLIEALGSRVFAVHLKDGPRHGAHGNQVALGLGELPWPAMLTALAPSVPRILALDLIENPFAAVRASRDWLTNEVGA